MSDGYTAGTGAGGGYCACQGAGTCVWCQDRWAKGEMDRLRRANETAGRCNDVLASEIDKLKAERSEIRADLERAAARIRQLEGQRDAAQEHAVEMGTAWREKLAEVERLRAELDACAAEANRTGHMPMHHQAESEALADEIDRLTLEARVGELEEGLAIAKAAAEAFWLSFFHMEGDRIVSIDYPSKPEAVAALERYRAWR